ncbi:6-pyruvoyl-tetrahydropterin synthase-related protein, partial [Oenococcus oeni]|uniref:6-pyruvoyl-tetrahydropterin synthase-related protein n=1 Tax=Oenococcus oeni TaxID=1247 RepID=UPI0015D6619A
IQGATTFFQSPVNFKVFQQYGYGVNWFYPFTIILPASFIFFLTGNIIFSYKAFIFLITFLTFIISYFCGKKFFKNDYASLVFSFVYGLSSFRMSELFLRADVAEMAAYSFLPMIFLGFYLMLDKNDKSGWKIFSLGICLVFFSHLLTLFICSIFLGIIFFVCIFSNYKNILNNFLKFIKKIIKSFITIIFVNLAFL